MKKQLLSLLFLLLAVTFHAPAQSFSTALWWGPAHEKFSPVVRDDCTITFRIKAPQARNAELLFDEWTVLRVPMTRDAEGVWEATIGPVAPGVYEYKFEIDGIKVLDLVNPSVKAGTEIYCNTVEVRGSEPRFDERVLTGSEIDVISYRSSVTGTYRRVCVYVPACYYERGCRKLPVLYLRHGGGDNELSWWQSAQADAIMDNLIASGEAVPMLVVMTDGLPEDGTWAGGSSPEGIARFERELVDDVIPLVESRYNVSRKRADRAIAGLSMGGGQAFMIGLRRTDLFSAVGEFSSGLLSDPALDFASYSVDLDAARINGALDLLWIACGTLDTRWEGHQAFSGMLTEKGIKHAFKSSDYGHQWQFWREQLRDFSSQLFKK